MKINLESGKKKMVCSCGASKDKPLCDGSHNAINEEKGTNYKPVFLSSEADTEIDVDSPNY